MGRRRSIMSEEFKNELAKDLGFYDTVKTEGWGGIRARDAGNMVGQKRPPYVTVLMILLVLSHMLFG